MDFVITAMPTPVADALRAGIPTAGTAPRRVVLTEAGAPCRHCLQPGQVGDEMLLVSYQPFAGDSPYAVPSPVFVHAGPCPRYPATSRIPTLVRDGVRAIRSYDAAHELLEGEVASGPAIEPLIDRLLADERVDYLHVYSATAGCFTCRVDRA
jgi:hypothetical protein